MQTVDERAHAGVGVGAGIEQQDHPVERNIGLQRAPAHSGRASEWSDSGRMTRVDSSIGAVIAAGVCALAVAQNTVIANERKARQPIGSECLFLGGMSAVRTAFIARTTFLSAYHDRSQVYPGGQFPHAELLHGRPGPLKLAYSSGSASAAAARCFGAARLFQFPRDLSYFRSANVSGSAFDGVRGQQEGTGVEIVQRLGQDRELTGHFVHESADDAAPDPGSP